MGKLRAGLTDKGTVCCSPGHVHVQVCRGMYDCVEQCRGGVEIENAILEVLNN